jgi:hypothetical protein
MSHGVNPPHLAALLQADFAAILAIANREMLHAADPRKPDPIKQQAWADAITLIRAAEAGALLAANAL